MSFGPDEGQIDPLTTRGRARRTFFEELSRAVHDPGRVGAPGSPAEMLRSLAVVVLDVHVLLPDGTCRSCVSVQGGLAESVEWPCEEIIRMGRIYGVWWTRT